MIINMDNRSHYNPDSKSTPPTENIRKAYKIPLIFITKLNLLVVFKVSLKLVSLCFSKKQSSLSLKVITAVICD